MATVDFTNAKIEPILSFPAQYNYMNLRSSVLQDSSNNSLVNNSSLSTVVSENKRLVFSYTGTFKASGTEFYIWNATSASKWKISNISFSAGDTYNFQIPITLTCN